MLYIEIIFSIITGLVFFFFFVINVTKRFRFSVNRSFAAACLFGTMSAVMFLVQLGNRDSASLTYYSRGYYSILLIICLFVFITTLIFPRWEKKSPVWLIISSAAPGIPLAFLTVFTDLFIVRTVYSNQLINTYSSYSYIYVIIVSLYLAGSYLVLLYKSRSLENEAFRMQLFPMIMGFNIGICVFLILHIGLPLYFNFAYLKNIAFSILAIITFSVMNYAVSDESRLNFRRFYVKSITGVMLFVILFVPVYLILEYGLISDFLGIQNNEFIIAAVVFIYCVVSFRFLKLLANKIITRKDKVLVSKFNELLVSLGQLSEMKKQRFNSELFYKKGIDSLTEILNIERAVFLLQDKQDDIFVLTHYFGEEVLLEDLDEKSELIRCLRENNRVIDKSMFYTDDKLSNYKENLLSYFRINKVEVVLPVPDNNNNLKAVLLLGAEKNGNYFPPDVLSLLEVYRIQFGHSLGNSLQSEEIREKENQKMNKLFVRNIKSRSLPDTFEGIEGIRLSSLYINNSDYGGDFFDSIKIGEEKQGIIIANTSDEGIESSILFLQLHSILHAQGEKYDSPEKLLGVINQVLASSRFTEKYISAIYLIYSSYNKEIIYSNAAFNPLMLFDSVKGSFQDLNIDGIPLGIDRTYHYEYKTFQAAPGSIGILYSDGISSAFDPDGNNYSINRIRDIIMMNKNDTPAILTRKVFADFKGFIKDSQLLNDVSLLIFKII